MTRQHSRRGVVIGAAAIFAGAAGARSAGALQEATPGAAGGLVAPEIEVAGVPPAVDQTTGPAGEQASSYRDVRLTAEEVEQVQAGGYSAAIVMHTSSAWSRAVEQGAIDAFDALGIEVVAQTDAGMDPAKQQSDAETVLARDPDIILTLPIDPVQAAAAFRPAVEAGVHLVFIDNPAEGFVQGTDYVGIVTGDHFALGQAAAEMLAEATGEIGRIGFIFHDADFYVTNQRDQAFKTVVEERFPGLEIVAEQGMADPADGEGIAAAMLTRDPGITAFYVPWAEPAEGVLAAIRAAGRDDVSVVTIDLDTTVALDMAQGGSVVGIAADTPYALGYTLALAGAYAILGKDAPPFTIVPTVKVTRENLAEGWRASLNEDVPAEVAEAAEAAGA